jgi:hypothetical protein
LCNFFAIFVGFAAIRLFSLSAMANDLGDQPIAGETTSASAGIQSAFASRLTKVPASAGSGDVEVSWSFINRWDFPLAVERFEESCSCLHGKGDAAVVEPGKSGTIRATFNAGQYRGVVRKSLHVRFIGHEKPAELVAEAFVASSVVLSSQELVWESGEPAAGQVIDVKAGTSASFRITDLRGLAPGEFAVEKTTVVEGRHYRLTLTPQLSAAGVRCLQIHTDSPDPRDRVLAVFLSQGAIPAPNHPEQGKPSAQTQPSLPHP